ncbi:RNA polymerase sigma-I factor [Dethiosulfatibacter aminovorans]|nr:RNA polymerase sigma-I factor [Dethiosulfatibacter aminovorans]
MDRNIMQNDIELVKNDDLSINDFIVKYKPFIYSAISKYDGTYISDQSELTSVGMLAFKEAVDNYDFDKGSFYGYSNLVIKSRLIDHFRKEARHYEREMVILDESYDSDNNIDTLERKRAIEEFNNQEKASYLREEITRFVSELTDYGIKMSDLEKLSPKKKELRMKYIAASEMIASDEGLLNRFYEMKRLPVSIIMERHGLNRKQVDRARKYLVALILIKCGDYEYLAEYIKI